MRHSYDGGVTWTDPAGNFEQARNVTTLPVYNSVIEPRIVATPGTIPSGKPEDIQNQDIYFVAYGTLHNVEQEEDRVPADLFYTRTTDFGANFDCFQVLADGPAEQGEVQIRMTPDGSKFYTTWLHDATLDSDIHFRKIDYNEPTPPPAPEDLCSDGLDNDSDGLTDCADPDCLGIDSCVHNEKLDLCIDGIDNDGDGRTDCDDPDCYPLEVCK